MALYLYFNDAPELLRYIDRLMNGMVQEPEQRPKSFVAFRTPHTVIYRRRILVRFGSDTEVLQCRFKDEEGLDSVVKELLKRKIDVFTASVFPSADQDPENMPIQPDVDLNLNTACPEPTE
jgi:hypothetical protein